MTKPKHKHRVRGSKLTQKEHIAQGQGRSNVARQHIPVSLPPAPWDKKQPSSAKEKKDHDC